MAREKISAADESRVMVELHEAALTFGKRYGLDIGDGEARGIVDRARTFTRRDRNGRPVAADANALGQVAGEVEKIRIDSAATARNVTAANGKMDATAIGARLGIEDALAESTKAARAAWRSSSDYDRVLAGEKAAERNLSPSLRRLIDPARGISADDVFDAVAFTRRLGMAPDIYGGYFIHTSNSFRTGMEAYINRGQRMTLDQFRRPEDIVGAVAAVQAGKARMEDLPTEIQKIIQEMKARGIDPKTAQPETIQQYLKDHPQALEVLKRRDTADQQRMQSNVPERRQQLEQQQVEVASSDSRRAGRQAAVPTTTL